MPHNWFGGGGVQPGDSEVEGWGWAVYWAWEVGSDLQKWAPCGDPDRGSWPTQSTCVTQTGSLSSEARKAGSWAGAGVQEAVGGRTGGSEPGIYFLLPVA